MPFRAVIPLENEQIDTVVEAVFRWCQANGQDIDGPAGQAAMNVAVSFAISRRPNQAELSRFLSREMGSRVVYIRPHWLTRKRRLSVRGAVRQY